jgi:uncharacterized protein (UPF0276 family)
MQNDRVGLGWRPALAAGIFEARDRIDVLEVIADDYVAAGRRHRAALKLLAREVPVHIHGIGLGLAGAEEVSDKWLDLFARLINDVVPEAWSEHLAFVRAGGIEIGHLAAPPRTVASVAAAARNLRKAAGIVGAVPMMENIATLVEPPCSTLNEQAWIADIVAASGCGFLLDLHNLYANATNFGFDPLQFLSEIPACACRLHSHRGRPVDRCRRRQQTILARRSPPRRGRSGLRSLVGSGRKGDAAADRDP